MVDTRKKDANWMIKTNPDGTTPTPDAHLSTLMDLRDELKKLNSVLSCHNFLDIPRKLDRIERNTKKPKPIERNTKKPKPRKLRVAK